MNWPLLHNMSSSPRVVLVHESPLEHGRLVVFELPDLRVARGSRALLAALDGQRFQGATAAVDTALRQRLNEHARELPWPAVVLAVDQASDGSERCTDLLTIVTVLSKTGSKVYLRDKEPNIAGLGSRRRVVLRFPATEERNQ